MQGGKPSEVQSTCLHWIIKGALIIKYMPDPIHKIHSHTHVCTSIRIQWYLHSFTNISLHIYIPDYPEVQKNCTWRLSCNQTSSKLLVGTRHPSISQNIPLAPSLGTPVAQKLSNWPFLPAQHLFFFQILEPYGFPKLLSPAALEPTVSPTSFKLVKTKTSGSNCSFHLIFEKHTSSIVPPEKGWWPLIVLDTL